MKYQFWIRRGLRHRMLMACLATMLAATTGSLGKTLALAPSLDEIVERWEDYAKRAKVTYKETVQRGTFEADGEKFPLDHDAIGILSPHGYASEVADQSSGTASVTARNRKYYFRLTKFSPQAEWAIENVTVKPHDAFNTDGSDLVKVWVFSALDLVRDPGFRVTSLSEGPGESEVSLDFRIDEVERPAVTEGSTSAETQIPQIESGRLLLDADNFFIVKHAELVGRADSAIDNITWDNRYEIREEFPIPLENRDVEVRRGPGDARNVGDHTVQYKVWDCEREFPHERFTLSYYGLPEPPEAHVPGSYRTQPWLYYFFGGVLCVAAGAFCAHRAIRRKV